MRGTRKRRQGNDANLAASIINAVADMGARRHYTLLITHHTSVSLLCNPSGDGGSSRGVLCSGCELGGDGCVTGRVTDV
eukprot:633642-Prorocentrum_minimum.AAC.6